MKTRRDTHGEYLQRNKRDKDSGGRADTRTTAARPSVRTEELNLPDILTAKELETFLRIDRKTIYGYVQKGLIPYIRIQSNVRFVRAQILCWMKERNYSPQPKNDQNTKTKAELR